MLRGWMDQLQGFWDCCDDGGRPGPNGWGAFWFAQLTKPDLAVNVQAACAQARHVRAIESTEQLQVDIATQFGVFKPIPA